MNLRANLLLLVASLLALTAFTAHAQTVPSVEAATAKAPAFDVISIRLNKDSSQMSGNGSFRMRVGSRSLPDGYSASNIDLKSLLANAYGVRPDQISGGSDWIASNHYDIEAKVVPADGTALQPLTKEQRNLMLRSLLADRFKLVVHTETKEASIYALTLAKGGPKLTASKPSEAPPPNIPPGAIVRGNPGDGPPRGGMMRMSGPGNLTVTAMTMTQFANMLSSQLHRTIVDQTGLTGTYDFTLQWTPDNLPASPGGEAQALDPTGPTIFTAVQEQLGLKLESTKGPVKTVVIDHIEPPSEN